MALERYIMRLLCRGSERSVVRPFRIFSQFLIDHRRFMSNTIRVQASPWGAKRFQDFEADPRAEVIGLLYTHVLREGTDCLTITQTDLHGAPVGSLVFFKQGIWGRFTEWDHNVWTAEYDAADEDCVRLVRVPRVSASFSASDSTKGSSCWSAE